MKKENIAVHVHTCIMMFQHLSYICSRLLPEVKKRRYSMRDSLYAMSLLGGSPVAKNVLIPNERVECFKSI